MVFLHVGIRNIIGDNISDNDYSVLSEKIHRIGIAFTGIWIHLLLCSHLSGFI